MNRRRAFSLIELLAVVAILSLLLSILAPMLGRAKELTRRAVCAAGIRLNGTALSSYASEFRQLLPMYGDQYNGNWFWDPAHKMRKAVVACGGSRQSMQCPSCMENDIEDIWWWGWYSNNQLAGKKPDELEADDYINYGGTGYWWMIKRLNGPNLNLALLAGKKWVTSINADQASLTELVTDVTMAQNGDFAHIRGGYLKALHRSNHLEGGGNPAGGNVLFVDTHLVWRPFAEMNLVRANPQPDHWY